MLTNLIAVALLPSASALALPTQPATAPAAMAAFCIGAESAVAYDSIPVVEPDFAAMEKARLVREQKASGKVKELKGKLAKVLASRTERDFVDAADEMALWVIAEQSIPEGIGVKAMAGELKDCFEALPKKGYACEATRTNNGVCFTPGRNAEFAYDSLLREVRKYSKIQLGDYRKVEFNAF